LAEADRLLPRTVARRCGVYIALAALALQFALSFGHIHRHDIVASDIVSSSQIDGVAGRQAPTSLDLSKQLPSGLADDDELCWICVSAQLLATSFIPAAPQPSRSFDVGDVERPFGRVADSVPASRRGPFQSRAPPLA
jgi:hypothetical protein